MHRLYEQGDIVVFWNSEKCRHAKRCVHGSPQTFDPNRRPWIDLTKAPTPEIWQAISACPTGALSCVYSHEIIVLFDEEHNRSLAFDKDVQIGKCDFRITPAGWEIYHTEVLPDYGNKGIAKRLVYRILETAEKKCINVIPICSYAVSLFSE